MNNLWRLILDPPMPGRVNMEKDLGLMEEVLSGVSLPVLRFYQWSSPTVSLGFFQDEEEIVDKASCKELCVEVVRRPTGGRAVLHDDELTYSIIVPEKHPFVSGGVIDSYRSISGGIVDAFKRLNIEAALVPIQQLPVKSAPGSCFDSSSAYEIHVKGKKVVGSAQLRRNGILLQHGSILFKLPAELSGRVLKKNLSPDGLLQKTALGARAAGLRDLGYNVDYDMLIKALVRAFSTTIPAAFTSTGMRKASGI